MYKRIIKFSIILISIILISNFNIQKKSETIPITNAPDITKDILLYNEPNDYILGTIDFLKYNQVNEIRLGTNDEVLNENFIGLHDLSVDLDKRPNHIVLAGHNKESLFRVITKLKLKDKIKINSILHEYYFEVISIKKYSKDYEMPFIIEDNILTLITCINKNKERLIITLKQV